MDEKLPVTPGPTHREDSFDVAVRGYNRQQVMDYMTRAGQLQAALEQQLADARAAVAEARAETDRSRLELAAQQAAAAESKPVHEEVSGRLSQILRLAAEEADQERAKADDEIAKLRADTKADVEQMLAEAHAQAEHELATARQTADAELTEAREEADTTLTAAREEADRLRMASVRQTQELLDEAQRRAGAVNEVSTQRLETLTATHGEAVLRLGQIRDVLADLLERDAAAGSLAQVVEAVISPPKAEVQPSAQELDDRIAGSLADDELAAESDDVATPDDLAATVAVESVEIDRSDLAGLEPDVEGSAADAELDAEDDEHSPARPGLTPVADVDIREPRIRDVEDPDPVPAVGSRAQQVLPRR